MCLQVFNLDGRDFIRKLLGGEEGGSMTQFVLNLPADAAEFLGAVSRTHHGFHSLPWVSETRTAPCLISFGLVCVNKCHA